MPCHHPFLSFVCFTCSFAPLHDCNRERLKLPVGISVHFVSQWPPPTVRARVRVCVWDLGVGHVDATSGCRDRQGESHFSNWGHHFHWLPFPRRPYAYYRGWEGGLVLRTCKEKTKTVARGADSGPRTARTPSGPFFALRVNCVEC